MQVDTNNPDDGVRVQIDDYEVTVDCHDKHYRIRGMAGNTSYELLKVNVMVTRDGLLHVDTLDLYDARRRISFCKQAAAEIHGDEVTIKRDLGRILLTLERIQTEQIRALQAARADRPYEISPKEEEAALAFLNAPDLVDQIVADFEGLGLVGESSNRLTAYLAATSRKLAKPLSIVVQSSSCAGKSTLMNATLAFVPPEDCVRVSAMTGQSLFYMGQDALKHKVLAIAEDIGARQATYAIKLLQSEGHLALTTTERDGNTGRRAARTYRAEGPTSVFCTTTAADVDDELVSRCVILTVDESREQTRMIQKLQGMRRTLDGQIADLEHSFRCKLHQNAQRLLRPLRVVNPFVSQLGFASHQIRNRRDFNAYLTLIDSIALLHQYQREQTTREINGEQVTFVIASEADIKLADCLVHEIVGRSIDELRPQTRKLLDLIYAMSSEYCQKNDQKLSEYRFTRRDVREYTGWGQTQMKMHLRRLEEMEHLIVHREPHVGRRISYELPSNDPVGLECGRLSDLISPT